MGLREKLPDYQRYLMGCALKMTNGHFARAEDFVQATFLRALEHEHTYREEGKLGGWLWMILHSLHVQERRRYFMATKKAPFVKGPLSVPPDQDIMIEWHEMADEFEKLSPEKAAAVYQIMVLGHTYEEHAQNAGVNIGTIKSRASRARSELTAALG